MTYQQLDARLLALYLQQPLTAATASGELAAIAAAIAANGIINYIAPAALLDHCLLRHMVHVDRLVFVATLDEAPYVDLVGEDEHSILLDLLCRVPLPADEFCSTADVLCQKYGLSTQTLGATLLRRLARILRVTDSKDHPLLSPLILATFVQVPAVPFH